MGGARACRDPEAGAALRRPLVGFSCSIFPKKQRRPRPPARPGGATRRPAGMVFLGLLQSGGLVLGQAMEQVTGGNLPSTLLIACAFTLSLVYLFRLAVGHMVQLPAGAVRAPQRSSFCAWVSLAMEGRRAGGPGGGCRRRCCRRS